MGVHSKKGCLSRVQGWVAASVCHAFRAGAMLVCTQLGVVCAQGSAVLRHRVCSVGVLYASLASASESFALFLHPLLALPSTSRPRRGSVGLLPVACVKASRDCPLSDFQSFATSQQRWRHVLSVRVVARMSREDAHGNTVKYGMLQL